MKSKYITLSLLKTVNCYSRTTTVNCSCELLLKSASRIRVTRKAWLGYFAPESCRGIVDYLQGGAFFASYLPIGQVPVDRGSDWQEVADLERLAVNIRGTIATTEGWRISEGAGTVPRDAYEWER